MTDVDGQEAQGTPKPRRLNVILTGILIFIIVIAGAFLFRTRLSHSPVPNSIQKSVPFKIYYPKQGKMPPGYHLDTASFRSAEAGVVLFSVSYDSGRSMVFSETAKPAGDVVDKFSSSAIPVHTNVNTPVGKGLIGAYGSGKDLRTVASLLVTNGPWLIVTAPADVNQTDLGQILQSLTK